MKFEQSVLRLLLQYLRQNAGVPGPPQSPGPSPGDELVGWYMHYLRNDRGLAENSILVYTPLICGLLHDQISKTSSVSIKALDAATIRSFLLRQVRDRSSEYTRLLATALSSYFRFLFLCGDLPPGRSPSRASNNKTA